jgi:hypothetical protein
LYGAYQWQNARNRFDRERGWDQMIRAVPNTILGGGTAQAWSTFTAPRTSAEAWDEDERQRFSMRETNEARLASIRARHEAEQGAIIARQDAENAAARAAAIARNPALANPRAAPVLAYEERRRGDAELRPVDERQLRLERAARTFGEIQAERLDAQLRANAEATRISPAARVNGLLNPDLPQRATDQRNMLREYQRQEQEALRARQDISGREKRRLRVDLLTRQDAQMQPDQYGADLATRMAAGVVPAGLMRLPDGRIVMGGGRSTGPGGPLVKPAAREDPRGTGVWFGYGPRGRGPPSSSKAPRTTNSATARSGTTKSAPSRSSSSRPR